MKYLTGAVCAVSLTLALAACGAPAEDTSAEASAASTISGTWVVQLDSAQFENSTSSYLIADGTYTCNSCLPPYSVATSGDWESVDRPGADGVKVTVIDDSSISLAVRKDGKELSSGTWTVSEDGQSMMVQSTDMSTEEPTTSSVTLTRAAAGPDGSHATSGDWDFAEFTEMSEEARTFTYAIDGDTFTQSTSGGGYTAILGGDAVAVQNSPAGAMVKVEKVSDNVYRETIMVDDETVNVIELTVDGDTLAGKSMDPRDESTVTWQAKRKVN